MNTMDTNNAFKRFEMENNIQVASEDLFKYDQDQQVKIREKAEWKKDPYYFKNVKISAVAVLKMLMHARDGLCKIPGQGEDFEVMGLMQGKIEGDSIVVMDCFGVLKGSEIRVAAGVADFEYMVQYTEMSERIGKISGVVGWYHSHPGMGCWLSLIDVNTQFNNQNFQDPYLAIVVDPKRTMSSGKVDLHAFRTWPENYNVPENQKLKAPRGKGDHEFGVHAHRYYELKVSVYKSGLDNTLLKQLWGKYWINTIALSRNLLNIDFDSERFAEMDERLREAESDIDKFKNGSKRKDEPEISVVSKEVSKAAGEQLGGVLDQLVKHQLFNLNL